MRGILTKHILAAVVVCFLLIGCTPTDDIELGGAFALSGFAAEWGEEDMQGALLAIEEANARGGVQGKNITLIIEDTQSTSRGTVGAYNKLVNVDEVEVIIGPTWLESYRGPASLAHEDEVVLMAASSSITAIKDSEKYPYVFSTYYRTDEMYDHLMGHLARNGQKEILIFFMQDPYWSDARRQIRAHAAEHDVEIIDEISVQPGETDFRSAILKIRSSDPDAVLVGFNAEKGYLSFLSQKIQLYPEMQVYGEVVVAGLVEKGQPEHLWANVSYVVPLPPSDDFVERYSQRWGENPSLSASNAYDATRIVLDAYRNGAESGEEVREHLLSDEFDTVTFGRVGFDSLLGLSGGHYAVKKVIPEG